jgi:hypothetical protein|tara:strand:- start:354 stop:602 length:249 start_codon:yes stop_codon:yes gene_type:complete
VKIKKQVLQKIIWEELQRECGAMPEPEPVGITNALTGGHSMAPDTTSASFGPGWQEAIEYLRAEHPEAAASLEALSGAPPAT